MWFNKNYPRTPFTDSIPLNARMFVLETIPSQKQMYCSMYSYISTNATIKNAQLYIYTIETPYFGLLDVLDSLENLENDPNVQKISLGHVTAIKSTVEGRGSVLYTLDNNYDSYYSFIVDPQGGISPQRPLMWISGVFEPYKLTHYTDELAQTYNIAYMSGNPVSIYFYNDVLYLYRYNLVDKVIITVGQNTFSIDVKDIDVTRSFKKSLMDGIVVTDFKPGKNLVDFVTEEQIIKTDDSCVLPYITSDCSVQCITPMTLKCVFNDNTPLDVYMIDTNTILNNQIPTLFKIVSVKQGTTCSFQVTSTFDSPDNYSYSHTGLWGKDQSGFINIVWLRITLSSENNKLFVHTDLGLDTNHFNYTDVIGIKIKS